MTPDPNVRLAYAVGPNGRMVAVKDVPSGLACGCRCPECSRRLVAKKGDVRAFHFAHEGDGSCQGAYESMVHRLAKDIIADDHGLTIPKVEARYKTETRTAFEEQWFPVDDVRLEVWRDGIRPDIVVNRMCPRQGEKRELAVEIYVTHRVDDEKLAAIRARGLATIEIDLSDIPRDIERCHLEPLVRQSASRCWLFNPKQDEYNEALRLEVEEEERAEREDVVKRQIREVVSIIAQCSHRKLPAWDVYRETDIPGIGKISDICRQGGLPYERCINSASSLIWMWGWKHEVIPGFGELSEGEAEAVCKSWEKPSESLGLGLPCLVTAFERQKARRKRLLIEKRAEMEELDRIIRAEEAEKARREMERARHEQAEAARREQERIERVEREKEQAERSAELERKRQDRLRALRSKIAAEANAMLGAEHSARWLMRENLHVLAERHDQGHSYVNAIAGELLKAFDRRNGKRKSGPIS